VRARIDRIDGSSRARHAFFAASRDLGVPAGVGIAIRSGRSADTQARRISRRAMHDDVREDARMRAGESQPTPLTQE
jgi:hypothetical protein